MHASSPRIEDSLLEEAGRLLRAAEAEGVPMRLLGGMGVRLLLGQRMHTRFQREIDDLDFITTRKASRAVERLLEQQGWQPVSHFNALHGRRRLLFEDPHADRRVDVFVEHFEMCHTLPLSQRLELRAHTLPAAELVMTKLQIVQLTAKDLHDLYALFDALEVASHDQDAINASHIADLASGDWGMHHTFELNLAKLTQGIDAAGFDSQGAAVVRRRVGTLRQALQDAPKSRAWRLRARIGERKRWYEEPDEVER